MEEDDVRNRENLTLEERKKILPVGTKDKSIHPNADVLRQKNKTGLEKLNEKIYTTIKGKGKYDSRFEESFENNKKNSGNDSLSMEDESWSKDRLGRLSHGFKQREKELENSSFSYDKNVKRYDELQKTKYLLYFKKDNGDIRVNMMDSNNNLVNQLDLWNETDAIK